MTLVPASDGLPAREVRSWNAEKLHYAEGYLNIFSTAMKDRWAYLAYADLLCGQGLCKDEGGAETPGSPVLALKRESFARLFFNDADERAIEALRARMDREGLANGRAVETTSRDCNEAAEQARAFLFPAGHARDTLGLAFIDNQGFEMTLDGLRRLTRGVRMDLLITFMTSFPKRFITQRGFGPESNFAKFIGPVAYRRYVQGRSRIQTHELLRAYRERLRTIGYRYVDDKVSVRNTNNSTIYHLVFASRHSLGKNFFEKISRRTSTGQQRMPGF